MEFRNSQICNDLKTERADVSQGLPAYFRAVPVLFYIGLVAACGLGSWFYVGFRSASASKEFWVQEDSKSQTANERIGKDRKEILEQNDRARDVVAWMEGAQGLQPLSVAITRSVAPTVTISELSLTRSTEIPSQIHFSLKLDGAGPDQLDRTLASVKELSYRAYSAQQTKAKSSLDYKATLIWQNPTQ
jgi:hypothetical protein